MKKSLMALFLIASAYTSIANAIDVTFINKLSEDITVNYIYCDKDYFCSGDEPVNITANSYTVLENVDSAYFAFIKATKAYSKNTDKKGKFSADGVCEVRLKHDGFLIFDNYNTNKIICIRG